MNIDKKRKGLKQMTRTQIEINQVSSYNNSYYTSKKELRTLANFLAKQLKGYAFNLVQDAKGSLKIQAIYHAVNCSLNQYQTFELHDYDVQNVLEVIKSNNFPPDKIMQKFTMKFAKF